MALAIAPPQRDLPRSSPRRNERDNIWRLCGWGGSALVAIGALVIATQAEVVTRKSEEARVPMQKPAVIAQVPAPQRDLQKDPQTLRLQAEVRALTDDRQRLSDRLASLERQLDEVTGSIRRQPAPPPAAQPAAAVATTSPPAVAAPTSRPAASPIAAAPAPTIPVIDPLAMPATTGSIGGWPETPGAQEQERQPAPAPAPVTAPKLEMREIRPAPMPLGDLSTPEEPKTGAPNTAARAEYGIDLGGARDMTVLRERWAGIKANLGPMLTGLQPIAVRDRKPGSTELRLIVGPMPDLASSRKICARFAAAKVACHAAKFDADAVVTR